MQNARTSITRRVFAEASTPLAALIIAATVLAAVAGNRIIGDRATHGVKVFLLPLLVLGAVLGVRLLVRLVRERQLQAFLKRTWPLFVLVAFDVVVLIVTTARFDGSPRRQYVFYLNFILVRLLMLAAFFAGLAVARWKRDSATIAVAATMLIASSVALVEYWGQLYPNALGSALVEWNERSYHWMWLFLDGPVTLRAMGLEIDPNFLGATAVVGIAYALASRIRIGARFAIAALATVMMVISQSRTAVLSAILLVVVFAGWRLYAFGLRRWLRRDAVFITAIALLVLATGIGLWAVGKQDPITSRIESSIELAEDSSKTLAVVDALTNSRGTIWVKVWHSYEEHPWGAWEATVKDVGRNAHNEALDRLHWAGPPMLLALLAAVFWLAACVRTPRAPAYGLLAGASLVVIGLMLQPTHLPGVVTLMMFVLGTLASQEWLLGDGTFVSLGETRGA